MIHLLLRINGDTKTFQVLLEASDHFTICTGAIQKKFIGISSRINLYVCPNVAGILPYSNVPMCPVDLYQMTPVAFRFGFIQTDRLPCMPTKCQHPQHRSSRCSSKMSQHQHPETFPTSSLDSERRQENVEVAATSFPLWTTPSRPLFRAL